MNLQVLTVHVEYLIQVLKNLICLLVICQQNDSNALNRKSVDVIENTSLHAIVTEVNVLCDELDEKKLGQCNRKGTNIK